MIPPRRAPKVSRTALGLSALVLLAAGAAVGLRGWPAGEHGGAEVAELVPAERATASGSRDPVAPPAGPGDFPTLAPSTPEEVRAIVRYCEEAGPERVAELRWVALEAEHPLVAGNAVRALGRLRAVAGDAALVELIADPRPRLRQETVLALGRSGDPAAVDVLAPLLEGEGADLRTLAIQALGELRCDRAWTVLAAHAPADDQERVFLRAALAGRDGE